MAQVLPLMLLALIWESRYLEGLRAEERRSRGTDPVGGVRFWTKSRVRGYSIAVASVVILDTGLSVFVLAGVLHDSGWLRGLVLGGLVLALASLLFRITVEILNATEES
ncbi:hypothetical protein FXF69_23630 [Actinomadura chibensis]|uniref:Uncharacterized protein n=2 Tax=Actinomadura chibensis TaxID=392828 RepID=A0A5D0NHZ0_9ACTN|nr:hypothetical protein FXF69_23630 [Actinomadura chibensis]